VTERLLVITPARNEAHQIKVTIESVLEQEHRPWRYYLVSDGSDDGTDEIMASYATKHDFIRYLRREKPADELERVEKVTPGKVGAIQQALESVFEGDIAYLGILDADVVLPVNYYKRLLEEFSRNENLGLAGGYLRSVLPNGNIAPGGFMNPEAPGGPAQTFRWKCYQDIGGYKPYGHEDCIALSEARNRGWQVRSFADIMVDHHVPYEGYAPTIHHKVPALYKLGKMDYVMFVPAWFVLLQSTARCFSKPYLFAGIARLTGYLSAIISHPTRMPPQKSWWGRQRSYGRTVASKLRRVSQRLAGN